jgi:microbial collagenase
MQGYTNVPLKFDSSGSYDPDGWLVEYLWVFGDNTVGQTQANPEHTYAQAGEYDVSLVVHDNYQVPSASSHAHNTHPGLHGTHL